MQLAMITMLLLVIIILMIGFAIMLMMIEENRFIMIRVIMDK